MSRDLTTEMLDELRTEITTYFEAYYSALRNEIAGHDALYDSIPHYFKGSREVVTNFCRDGVVIVHRPAETDKDSYVFESVLDTRVEDVVGNYTPTLPSGESATITFQWVSHVLGRYVTKGTGIENLGTRPPNLTGASSPEECIPIVGLRTS